MREIWQIKIGCSRLVLNLRQSNLDNIRILNLVESMKERIFDLFDTHFLPDLNFA